MLCLGLLIGIDFFVMDFYVMDFYFMELYAIHFNVID